MPLPSSVNSFGPMEALVENVDRAIFTKHSDWADEAEYRLFVASDSLEDFLVPIGADVIVGLVLGPCFDSDNFRDVEAFARRFEIVGRTRMLSWISGFGQPIPVDYS